MTEPIKLHMLTPAQRRYLEAIRQAGVKVYNDRARKPLEALEAAGLITVDWDMRAQTKGNGIELVGCNTARPVVQPDPNHAGPGQ
jgi:hypothetical protein